MYRMSALVLQAALWLLAPAHAADELLNAPERITSLLKSGALYEEKIPNPHWREEGCVACHPKGRKGAPQLRDVDINRMCNNCHEISSVGAYIHAVGMPPPDDFIARMPKPFREAIQRGGGNVTCIACHDLPAQCDSKRWSEQKLNPRFFRGGPYWERTDLCFNCHDRRKYERYNPHDQITDEGELDQQRCYVCHSVTPNRKSAESIADVQFNLVEKMEQLCTGCHPWRPHPGGGWASFAKGSTKGGGPNHLVVPPKPILDRLERHQRDHDIVMPLEPETNRIFCATCHNPHERGVQYRHAADKGADGVRRLRRARYEICEACHDK